MIDYYCHNKRVILNKYAHLCAYFYSCPLQSLPTTVTVVSFPINESEILLFEYRISFDSKLQIWSKDVVWKSNHSVISDGTENVSIVFNGKMKNGVQYFIGSFSLTKNGSEMVNGVTYVLLCINFCLLAKPDGKYKLKVRNILSKWRAAKNVAHAIGKISIRTTVDEKPLLPV